MSDFPLNQSPAFVAHLGHWPRLSTCRSSCWSLGLLKLKDLWSMATEGSNSSSPDAVSLEYTILLRFHPLIICFYHLLVVSWIIYNTINTAIFSHFTPIYRHPFPSPRNPLCQWFEAAAPHPHPTITSWKCSSSFSQWWFHDSYSGCIACHIPSISNYGVCSPWL